MKESLLSNGIAGFVNRTNKNNFSIILTTFFAIIVGIGMNHHEMWRDEYEWYLFRLYHGIFDPNDPCYNFYNALCCLFLKINPSIATFQILHFLIIVCAIAILAFKSPFTNVEKALLTFGYFFIFEYGIISRYYGFTVLVLFILTHHICRNNKNFPIIAGLIIILAETNPNSTVLALGISFYVLADVYFKIKSNELKFSRNYNLIFGALIFFGGWLLLGLYFGIYLPKVAPIIQYKGGTPPILSMVNQIWNSYIPIPDLRPEVRFWWSNILNFNICYPLGYKFSIADLTSEFALSFLFSLIILFVISARLANNLLVLCTYLITTLLLGIFLQHFMKCYTIRYLGSLFMAFIACYWIFCSSKDPTKIQYNQFPKAGEFFKDRINKSKVYGTLIMLFPYILYFILMSQVFAGIYAYRKDLKYKFSHSNDLIEYIKWNKYNDSHLIVGYPDYGSECIAATLKTKVFYPQLNEFRYDDDSYNPKRKKIMSIDEVLKTSIKVAEDYKKPVLLVLTFPIMSSDNQILTGPVLLKSNLSLCLIKDFSDDVICGDELYWIYEIKNQ
jgi:hypothetical protein